MKCINCSYENQENFDYCPMCGAAQQQFISINPAADKILYALKDDMFLAICILLTISCGLSVVCGGLPLINILTTIFLWIVFSKSRNNIADADSLRSVSGTIYANYIITYVLFGLIFVIGIIIGLVFSLVNNIPELLNEISTEFYINDNSYIIDDSYLDIAESVISVFGWIIMAMFAFASIIGIVINAVSMRKIHLLAKSVYQGVQTGYLDLKYANSAKNWLFVFGVFSAISAAAALLSWNIISGLTTGCSAAAEIIAGILIKKHLLSANPY